MQEHVSTLPVLILVVVEDGLVLMFVSLLLITYGVLILVVVEDGLVRGNHVMIAGNFASS